MSSSDQTYEKIPAPSGSLTTGRLISLSWLKILGLVIFLLLIGRFAVVGWTRISLNANSADGDQPAYLRLGLDIREQGQWTDGKRPPLYPALLSTFASRTWAYFTWAKIVSLTFGLIAIGLIFEIGRRLFNPATGLLAAFLLAINAEFMLHSVVALAEPLLVLLVLISAGMTALFRQGWNTPRLPTWGRVGLAVLAGLTGIWLTQRFILNDVVNARETVQDPFAADIEFNNYNEQSLVWAEEGHTRTDPITILWGPSHNVPTWRLSDSFSFVRTPLVADSYEQLESFAQAEDVTYIIIDDDMVRRRHLSDGEYLSSLAHPGSPAESTSFFWVACVGDAGPKHV